MRQKTSSVEVKQLTDKQEKFCLQYIVDLNGTQAAIRAGYSKKTADVIATQNLVKLSIKKRIDELKEKAAKEAGVSIQDVLDGFKTIAFGKISKNLNNKHKISALENIGKHIGFYAEHNKQLKDPVSELIIAIGANGVGLQIKQS